jgi:hypothetical protein
MRRIRDKGELALLIASPLVGLVYGLFTRLVFDLGWLDDWYAIVTLTYIFGVPVVVGVLAVVVLPEAQARRWPSWLAYPGGAGLLIAATTLLLAWEGLICAVVWLPLFLLLAILGGVAAGLGRRLWSSARSRSLVFGLAALAPLVLAPLEPQGASIPAYRVVTNRIAIDAPATVIWGQIREVPAIDPAELPASWTLRIGFPRPIEARLVGSGVGAVRHATFERDVLFVEEITEWRPGVALAFEITPEHVPRRAFDEHVAIGGRYFDVLTGRYEIQPRPDGDYDLVLRSEQRVSTPFNWYTSLWTDLFMSDIQGTILRVIKARSEAAAGG